MIKKTLRLHFSDNVAVALEDLAPADICQGTVIRDVIPKGHKFALSDIKKDENIIKYGSPIGHALNGIEAGSWVHSHNMATNLSETLKFDSGADSEKRPETYQKPVQKMSAGFMGYRRKDGRVGIRNELWILPMVGCVNDVCKAIENAVAPMAQKYGIDGVYHFAHPYGCSQLGEDHENTRRILRDLVFHPNAGAVLCVALGCENNTLDSFRELCGTEYEDKVRYLTCQKVDDEISEGIRLCEELFRYAGQAVRTECNMEDLAIGLKCGGSDGLSGITANPVAGAFSDCLISNGGTTVLTEVPEMFGAENMLFARIGSKELFDKGVDMVNGFRKYFLENGQPVGENPSPGNKEGGITTLEEKSLGCVQKGGTAPVSDILFYGDILKKKGLNLLCAPGNDLVSSTALAASGVQMVLFTTGRGTPFSAPVPTIKISTNTELFQKKKNWIDLDAGTVVDHMTIEAAADELMEYCLQIASGIRTKSEINGQHGMAIWKKGVTL